MGDSVWNRSRFPHSGPIGGCGEYLADAASMDYGRKKVCFCWRDQLSLHRNPGSHGFGYAGKSGACIITSIDVSVLALAPLVIPATLTVQAVSRTPSFSQ